MRSKLIAALVAVLALSVPATAMADGSQGGSAAGGNGQAQQSSQWSATLQGAVSEAKASQNGVNSNAPANTAGGNITTGSNTATQNN